MTAAIATTTLATAIHAEISAQRTCAFASRYWNEISVASWECSVPYASSAR